jgi:stalled ribosome rescue protein Dom34
MPHNPTRALVWLDSREARIFLITAEDVESGRIKADAPHRTVRHKASGHVRDDRKYLEAVLAAIENADSWLMVGPRGTRNDLDKYLDQHAEELKKKLLGVKAMDHPTDGELLAHARRLFKAHVRT